MKATARTRLSAQPCTSLARAVARATECNTMQHFSHIFRAPAGRVASCRPLTNGEPKCSWVHKVAQLCTTWKQVPATNAFNTISATTRATECNTMQRFFHILRAPAGSVVYQPPPRVLARSNTGVHKSAQLRTIWKRAPATNAFHAISATTRETECDTMRRFSQILHAPAGKVVYQSPPECLPASSDVSCATCAVSHRWGEPRTLECTNLHKSAQLCTARRLELAPVAHRAKTRVTNPPTIFCA